MRTFELRQPQHALFIWGFSLGGPQAVYLAEKYMSEVLLPLLCNTNFTRFVRWCWTISSPRCQVLSMPGSRSPDCPMNSSRILRSKTLSGRSAVSLELTKFPFYSCRVKETGWFGGKIWKSSLKFVELQPKKWSTSQAATASRRKCRVTGPASTSSSAQLSKGA